MGQENYQEEDVWKDIEGYEGLYMVSTLGRIWSNYTKKILKPQMTKDGYLRVCLFNDGKYKWHYIHRLVAQAFLENTENKPCINHINTVRSDNRLENLEWVTYKENSNHPLSVKNRKDPSYSGYYSEAAKESMKRYCDNHKEQRSARHKAWREANPDYSKDWYQANREQIREQHRQYYATNRDKELERRRQYYATNRDKVNERRKVWYEKKREQILAKKREYKARNRERIKEQNRQYREAHPDYGKAWRESHREELREYYRQYRARKKAEKLLQNQGEAA